MILFERIADAGSSAYMGQAIFEKIFSFK